MWGLILKDFYTLARYSKFLIVYMAIFGAISMGEGNSYFSSIIVMMVAMLSISTFSYDDMAKWDKYALSTPLGRKKIVMAKYILVVLLVLLGTAIGGVLNWVGVAFFGGGDLLGSMASLGVVALLGATVTSLTIPLIYKFGTEKSRLMMMLIFALPTGLIMLVARFLPEGAPPEMIEQLLLTALKIAPLLCIVVICFSYVISVKIFEKKEIQ